MNWSYYPKNQKIPPNMLRLVEAFSESEGAISSHTHQFKSMKY